MTQAYQTQVAAQESAELAFKRHILEKSAGFVSEPMADAYRVSLLSQMLDRYDALLAQGMSNESAMDRTLYEFDDISGRMRGMGFAEVGQETDYSGWPQMTLQEAERYIRERDAYMHRISWGVFLCTASLVPMMLLIALSEVFQLLEDFGPLFGVAGMFAMIGTGVYAMVTAAKPKAEKMIREKRFALTRSVRQKLTAIQEKRKMKARKRRGRGIAMCVTSLIPVLLGAALSEVVYSDAFPILGVAGMFAMIGAGVYDLVMASAEKETVGQILKIKE